MTLTLDATKTVAGSAASASAVTYTLLGDEVGSSADTFKVLAQGQLGTSAATLYTAPGSTATIVKSIVLANTSASAVAVTMYIGGTAAANSIGNLNIPGNGEAMWGADGWKLLDGNSAVPMSVASTLTGDVTGSGVGTIPTTLAATGVTAGTYRSVTVDAKGRVTAGTTPGIPTNWIDVTLQASPVNTSNSAATNLTNMNAILAAAPAGSTIYFPGGTYNFSGAWTMPAANAFTFQGQGGAVSGGQTILAWTSNVAGSFITIGASAWYTTFNNIAFVSSGVTQTAGAVVDVNGTVGSNFYNCTFGAIGGGFLFNCLQGAGSNSWNSAIIFNCLFNNYKNIGILINSGGASLVVESCVIQGAWGGFSGAPASLQAVAGINAQNCGALQLVTSDVLGNQNNLLLNPASGQVCASVFCTNTYFDNSGGSCVKLSGVGAVVRAIFTDCSFTTAGTNYTTAGTAFSAVEIGGSFAFGAGGQSISFTDCNIFNTFGTTGTSNGVTTTGTYADVYFTGCKVAGWTNGYNIAASGTNISFPKILGGACGPSGGYGANTTGFNIAAGAYKGLCIQEVNAHGNTTNLTLGAVTVAAADASLFRITDNTGINPRGAVTTPTFPASATAVTNTTGFRVVVGIKGGTSSAVAVNGVASVLAATPATVVLDPGGTVSVTFTVAPTWTWAAN
jgi:hypothetical protein